MVTTTGFAVSGATTSARGFPVELSGSAGTPVTGSRKRPRPGGSVHCLRGAVDGRQHRVDTGVSMPSDGWPTARMGTVKVKLAV